MTYTLCILLIYYAIAYCLLLLMSAMLESISQNVPYEVVAAQERVKWLLLGRGSVTMWGWPTLG